METFLTVLVQVHRAYEYFMNRKIFSDTEFQLEIY